MIAAVAGQDTIVLNERASAFCSCCCSCFWWVRQDQVSDKGSLALVGQLLLVVVVVVVVEAV